MATNKRKDSAALFELISKSTLKVPKTAGGLKIPSWWSNKTPGSPPAPPPAHSTPPATDSPPAPPPALKPTLPLNATPPSIPASSPLSSPISRSISPALSSATTTQAALPLHDDDDSTESAPPVLHTQGNSGAAINRALTAISPEQTPLKDDQWDALPLPDPDDSAHAQPSASIPPPAPAPPIRLPLPSEISPRNDNPAAAKKSNPFAPSTFDPSRYPRRPSMFGRVPPLVIGLALTFAAGLIILIAIGLHAWAKSCANPESPTAIEGPFVPSPNQNIPTKPSPNNNTPATPAPSNANPPPAQPATPPEPEVTLIPGRVIPANEVKRTPGLRYLVILTTPSERIANANADFLIKNGMTDISIEQNSKGNFSVITVQGAARLDDPWLIAVRKKVVEIGAHHPDAARQHRSVYYDAYAPKWTRPY